MLAGDRFKNWIEGLSESWKDQLRGWLLRSIAEGVKKFLEDEEPGAIADVDDILTKIKANPNTPPELISLVSRIEGGGSWVMIVIVVIFGIVMAIQAVQTIWAPEIKRMNYAEERISQSYRLDPMSVITAWRRDKPTYEKLFDDLRDQGWGPDRLEALKFLTLFYPAPADLVRWQAREVFEPEMVERYGLDSEYGAIEKEPFYKAGMTDEQILNYWRAHWEHASWNQVVEMLRRGQLTEEEVWDWFRVVEIPPYWRDKLTAISWEVPTRVDVRRFWDMRTIDESRLREIYTAQGYHGKDLEDYVLWTKIYVDFPDLMTRYKNGWLTLDDVRSELVGLGMSAERAEELIQTKVKAVASEKLVKERDLTMSQIVKGVKKAVLSRAEGAGLLTDMGYDPYEAEFILAIEIPQDEVVTEVKIRELTKADILKGLKTDIITEDEALNKLLALRYRLDDAEFILSIYKATVKPPAEAKEREASKADIVKAVKTGLITPEDAYLMLLDIGFSPGASEFILMVHAEESPFSPMSYNEYKELTEKFRQVVRPGEPTMPEELKAAAAEVVRLTAEVEALNRSIEEEKRGLVEDEALPEEATARLTELEVTRNRAIAEQQRVQSEYDTRVAEWRHRPTV